MVEMCQLHKVCSLQLLLNLFCVFQPLAFSALPCLVSWASLYRFPIVARVEAYMLERRDQKMSKPQCIIFLLNYPPPQKKNKSRKERKQEKKTVVVYVCGNKNNQI